MTESFAPYLRATSSIDSDHATVVAWAREVVGKERDEVAKAVRLFYSVRDDIRYDPYLDHTDPEIFKASYTLERRSNYCVAKAILLAAGARVHAIPSRLGFADVRNHLATKRFLELLGTDVFRFHGYTELFLEGRWVKATPTFNLSLCEKFGVKPLEFDGRTDSVLHPFDREGRRHMEYLQDRGVRADLPLDELIRAYKRYHPHLFGADGRLRAFDRDTRTFEEEAAAERLADRSDRPG